MTQPPLDWEGVYRLEARRLTRFLHRFGAAVSAEDIMQETFVRVCRIDLAVVTSPRGLLYRTARNLALNAIKRASIAPERAVDDITALSDAIEAASSPEDVAFAAERARAFVSAIEALPDTQRVAFVGRNVDRRSSKEIAQQLGVTPRQVQRLILQAEDRIRAACSIYEGTAVCGPNVQSRTGNRCC